MKNRRVTNVERLLDFSVSGPTDDVASSMIRDARVDQQGARTEMLCSPPDKLRHAFAHHRIVIPAGAG
jgi:hypothetical protein